MQSFRSTFELAVERAGGIDVLEQKLECPKPASMIREIPDDRWLSAMTKCVFQAGFSWKVIDNKWPGFEAVFEQFDVSRWVLMSDDDLDRLLQTGAIVRNGAKIRSVRDNAVMLRDLIEKHGSVGAYFASWQLADYSRNMMDLQKTGSRLGGKTGQIFLRRMGVDTLVFTKDVLTALAREGLISKQPTSKKAWDDVQHIITEWHAESGRSLNEISQILAFSV